MEPPIAVLGGGSWGTALAWLLGGKGLPVRLWTRHPEHAARMEAERENSRYLPGLTLPESVEPTADLQLAVCESSCLVLAVPTQAARETMRHAAQLCRPDVPVVIAAKGLEQDTGKRLSRVVAEELGFGAEERIAVLSGPNLAGEIVRSIPTATVIAAEGDELPARLQETFGTPTFRVYTNTDLAGVELGGALKNPIAVAAGISDGLGYGANTRATLLTRGLAEITRLGVAAGAQAATFSGLSGLGDLMATAHSPLSRNYRLGLSLGQGETLPAARASLHQVAEGVPTTAAAVRLAKELGVSTPILDELHRVLFDGKPVREAVTILMARPYKDEADSG